MQRGFSRDQQWLGLTRQTESGLDRVILARPALLEATSSVAVDERDGGQITVLSLSAYDWRILGDRLEGTGFWSRKFSDSVLHDGAHYYVTVRIGSRSRDICSVYAIPLADLEADLRDRMLALTNARPERVNCLLSPCSDVWPAPNDLANWCSNGRKLIRANASCTTLMMKKIRVVQVVFTDTSRRQYTYDDGGSFFRSYGIDLGTELDRPMPEASCAPDAWFELRCPF
jgi:hypothetical protein